MGKRPWLFKVNYIEGYIREAEDESIVIRLVFSLVFGVKLKLGVIGIAWAMVLDWSVRGLIFAVRFRHGNWKSCHVLS